MSSCATCPCRRPHPITLINDFGERGINLPSLTEPALDTTSPMGRTLGEIMRVLAQLYVCGHDSVLKACADVSARVMDPRWKVRVRKLVVPPQNG